eukprot:224104-Chlamydomonas_euryale.AAC.1
MQVSAAERREGLECMCGNSRASRHGGHAQVDGHERVGGAWKARGGLTYPSRTQVGLCNAYGALRHLSKGPPLSTPNSKPVLSQQPRSEPHIRPVATAAV